MNFYEYETIQFRAPSPYGKRMHKLFDYSRRMELHSTIDEIIEFIKTDDEYSITHPHMCAGVVAKRVHGVYRHKTVPIFMKSIEWSEKMLGTIQNPTREMIELHNMLWEI